MTFEEDFPGLRGKWFWSMDKKIAKRIGCPTPSLLTTVDVQKHCLDKEKVKQAIQSNSQYCKIADGNCNFCTDGTRTIEELNKAGIFCIDPNINKSKLLKELGL